MIYRFMRTLILEQSSEVIYYVPFLRSYSSLSDGFFPEEVEEVRRVLSGGQQKGQKKLSTEITFDRAKLSSLLSGKSPNLTSAVTSVEIHTDVDEDPVTYDLAKAMSLKINNQISLSRKTEPLENLTKKEKEKEAMSIPSEISGITASSRLLEMIKKFEGFREHPYICPGGQLTIGYGKAIKPGEYTSITKGEAEVLLRNTVASFERSVKKLVTVPLNQNQYDALVSFAYNVGIGSFKRSTLLKKLNAGDYTGAADELPKWNKSKGKILKGLVRRREIERNLFLS